MSLPGLLGLAVGAFLALTSKMLHTQKIIDEYLVSLHFTLSGLMMIHSVEHGDRWACMVSS